MLVLRVFDSWEVLNPDTGYLVLEESEADSWGLGPRGFLGITNAFVCFSKERSLQRADISGKSKFLLFSRSTLMSIACCWAAVRLLGAMILFDSGQMTCESFKSSGLGVEELGVEAGVFGGSTAEVFGCVFADKDEEDFKVDGFAGTRMKEVLADILRKFSSRKSVTS